MERVILGWVYAMVALSVLVMNSKALKMSTNGAKVIVVNEKGFFSSSTLVFKLQTCGQVDLLLATTRLNVEKRAEYTFRINVAMSRSDEKNTVLYSRKPQMTLQQAWDLCHAPVWLTVSAVRGHLSISNPCNSRDVFKFEMDPYVPIKFAGVSSSGKADWELAKIPDCPKPGREEESNGTKKSGFFQMKSLLLKTKGKSKLLVNYGFSREQVKSLQLNVRGCAVAVVTLSKTSKIFSSETYTISLNEPITRLNKTVTRVRRCEHKKCSTLGLLAPNGHLDTCKQAAAFFLTIRKGVFSVGYKCDSKSGKSWKVDNLDQPFIGIYSKSKQKATDWIVRKSPCMASYSLSAPRPRVIKLRTNGDGKVTHLKDKGIRASPTLTFQLRTCGHADLLLATSDAKLRSNKSEYTFRMNAGQAGSRETFLYTDGSRRSKLILQQSHSLCKTPVWLTVTFHDGNMTISEYCSTHKFRFPMDVSTTIMYAGLVSDGVALWAFANMSRCPRKGTINNKKAGANTRQGFFQLKSIQLKPHTNGRVLNEHGFDLMHSKTLQLRLTTCDVTTIWLSKPGAVLFDNAYNIVMNEYDTVTKRRFTDIRFCKISSCKSVFKIMPPTIAQDCTRTISYFLGLQQGMLGFGYLCEHDTGRTWRIKNPFDTVSICLKSQSKEEKTLWELSVNNCTTNYTTQRRDGLGQDIFPSVVSKEHRNKTGGAKDLGNKTAMNKTENTNSSKKQETLNDKSSTGSMRSSTVKYASSTDRHDPSTATYNSSVVGYDSSTVAYDRAAKKTQSPRLQETTTLIRGNGKQTSTSLPYVDAVPTGVTSNREAAPGTTATYATTPSPSTAVSSSQQQTTVTENDTNFSNESDMDNVDIKSSTNNEMTVEDESKVRFKMFTTVRYVITQTRTQGLRETTTQISEYVKQSGQPGQSDISPTGVGLDRRNGVSEGKSASLSVDGDRNSSSVVTNATVDAGGATGAIQSTDAPFTEQTYPFEKAATPYKTTRTNKTSFENSSTGQMSINGEFRKHSEMSTVKYDSTGKGSYSLEATTTLIPDNVKNITASGGVPADVDRSRDGVVKRNDTQTASMSSLSVDLGRDAKLGVDPPTLGPDMATESWKTTTFVVKSVTSSVGLLSTQPGTGTGSRKNATSVVKSPSPNVNVKRTSTSGVDAGTETVSVRNPPSTLKHLVLKEAISSVDASNAVTAKRTVHDTTTSNTNKNTNTKVKPSREAVTDESTKTPTNPATATYNMKEGIDTSPSSLNDDDGISANSSVRTSKQSNITGAEHNMNNKTSTTKGKIDNSYINHAITNEMSPTTPVVIPSPSRFDRARYGNTGTVPSVPRSVDSRTEKSTSKTLPEGKDLKEDESFEKNKISNTHASTKSPSVQQGKEGMKDEEHDDDYDLGVFPQGTMSTLPRSMPSAFVTGTGINAAIKTTQAPLLHAEHNVTRNNQRLRAGLNPKNTTMTQDLDNTLPRGDGCNLFVHSFMMSVMLVHL